MANPDGSHAGEAGTETVLSDDECWQFLREHEFGRLAFHLADEVHLTPINYAVDGRSLLFRTAPGSKLLGIVMNANVAFEIDHFSETQVRSVVVRGNARLLEEDEAHRAESVPLRSWVGQEKYNVVELVPSVVSGRRFGLNRPWFHQVPGHAE